MDHLSEGDQLAEDEPEVDHLGIGGEGKFLHHAGEDGRPVSSGVSWETALELNCQLLRLPCQSSKSFCQKGAFPVCTHTETHVCKSVLKSADSLSL